MSDIDVDDSKSEILDVGDAGSDNIGDDEVFMMFTIFRKLHDHNSRKWSDLKCPPPLPSLLSDLTRESPLLSYLQHQQVSGKSTNGSMVYLFSFHNSERI